MRSFDFRSEIYGHSTAHGFSQREFAHIAHYYDFKMATGRWKDRLKVHNVQKTTKNNQETSWRRLSSIFMSFVWI